MIKFLLLLFLGIYIFRTLAVALVRLFFKSVVPPQKKPTTHKSKQKQNMDSSAVGEYIDYEEVD